MSHQTESEVAKDSTFQGRCRVALMNKCREIYQDTEATNLDLRIAAGVQQHGSTFVREAAYLLAGSGLDHNSTDAEMDGTLETLWPLSIAYIVGALTPPSNA